MQPITLHGHAGPNPWKVALILEELSIPYETKIWATADLKKPPFTTTLNPNGFTPVIVDPNNNDLKVWESGAIISYLLETYDTPAHLISFPHSSLEERAHLQQYHFFQCTFQGPNLSTVFYFTRTNPNPEARKRFVGESLRVLEVLDGTLKEKVWLVGGKCTAADLVFVPYMWSMDLILGDDKVDLARDYHNVEIWLQRMSDRASVKRVKAARDAALAALVAGAAQAAQKTGK